MPIEVEALTTNSTILEIQEEEPSTEVFDAINIVLSSVLALILISLPIFIAIFYPINFKRMGDEDFEKKYGEVYGGMHPDRVECIVHPIFFLLRRYAFVLTICLPMLSDKAWLQIEAQLILTMVSLVFLLHFDMYLESLVENLEIFNEVTTLVLLYHLLVFTKFVSEINTQYLVGFSFAFFLSLNMATHVYFLLRSSFRDCKKNQKLRKAKK